MTNIFENGPSGSGRIVNAIFLSVMNRDSVLIGKTLMGMNDLECRVRIVCADSEDLDGDEEAFVDFMNEVRDTQLIMGSFHGDESHFKKYDRMMELVGSRGTDMLYFGSIPDANAENRHLFKHSNAEYTTLGALVHLGGPENYRSAILWMEKNLAGIADIEVPDPVHGPTEGVGIPGREGMSPEELFDSLDPSKPTVAVIMPTVYWEKGRHEPVDDLCRRLEELGANAIPLFCISSPDDISGSLGIEGTMGKYLRKEGKTIADVIVMAVGFSQINLNNVSGSKDAKNFFLDMDVPVIQGQSVSRKISDWEEDVIGMNALEIGANVIWPEYDGQIISVPLSFTSRTEDGEFVATSVPDRVERIATQAVAWARLRHTPPEDRKVAIMLNMYPPTNDHVGGAAGLDTFESIRRCLIAMKGQGYRVDRIPENGNEVVDELMAGLTNDLEWVSEGEIRERAADMVSLDRYMEWYRPISSKVKEGMVRNWGDPPGEITVSGSELIIPGVRNGNVFIGLQPNRGLHAQAETLYHDPNVLMPHQYLAYYRWIKDVFGAHLIAHMGTHGTLEWLPGKGNGLSKDCCPDVILDTMPNVYTYIIDDPGEGIQCKRRTNSVLVGYMCPSMTRAGGYDEMMELDGVLQEYLNSRGSLQEDKKRVLHEKIFELVGGLSMFKEIGLGEDCTAEDVAGKIDLIYDYVSDLKDALIKDGLHILGAVPEGERMKEMVYSLCRLRNGDVPSLRASVAEAMGQDLDALLDDPHGFNQQCGKVNGAVADEIDLRFNELIDRMYDLDFDTVRVLEEAGSMFGTLPEGMSKSLRYVCESIHPGILRMTDETDNYLVGVRGGYVRPGPSGSPTRGNAHLLPTGTNYYSVDPDAIPTQSSWLIGSKMAEDMVSKYVADNGKYPESVGIVVWATDTMKTCGDDISYILALMGLRPKWGMVGSKVLGLEVIPASELGRPRIDVMPRISGLFRDSFPALTDMFVEGMAMVEALDESDDQNYYKKHLREDISRYISEGMLPAEAEDTARIRVFGDPPGQHGNGVSVLIESSKWDTVDQIAETYATWGAYAYGGKWKGQKVSKAFKSRVGALDVTVKNHNDREFDMLDIDDDYDSVGGMNAAVKVFGNGKKAYCVMGDSSDTDRLKTRTLEEETAYVMRSRVLNPKWVDGLKEHGYRGAMELSKLTEYMLGWSATSENIEPWMYEEVTRRFLLDEENRRWVEENNPYALRAMLDDLLEAIDRDLWDAPQETRDRLREMYLEAEGELEKRGESR